MKIFITGGAGFVGQWLTESYEADGHDVCWFDLSEGDDIRDYESLRCAIDSYQPDLVHSLAAQAYVPESTVNPERGLQVNSLGTLNVLRALKETGSPARLHVSGTSEEYGYNCDFIDENTPCDPTTPYGVSKQTATNLAMVYAQMYGMPIVVTRAFNHTGPRHQPVYAVPSFARRVALVLAGKEKSVKHGNLDAVRNYLDVRDVVRAYRLAVDLPSGIYNVCADRSWALKEVLDMLTKIAGENIATEVDANLWRPGSTHFPKTTAQKLKSATDWGPEIPLKQTLGDTLNYWKERV